MYQIASFFFRESIYPLITFAAHTSKIIKLFLVYQKKELRKSVNAEYIDDENTTITLMKFDCPLAFISNEGVLR